MQFERFRKVPDHLGHVIEIGCGPFTPAAHASEHQESILKVSSVTLADPILVHESKMPKSAFRTGKFVDNDGVAYPTTLHQVGAEAVGSLYHEAFDTVIMMNVLEHCEVLHMRCSNPSIISLSRAVLSSFGNPRILDGLIGACKPGRTCCSTYHCR